MKKARIEIRDSKRTIEGKAVQAYRVVCLGANGELLQNSEVLNDKNAVYTHIKAMAKLWTFGLEATKSPSGYPALVDDKTKAQTFAKKGLKVA
jgi:hypothetical protein